MLWAKVSWRKGKGFTMFSILLSYLLLLWCCGGSQEMDQCISSLRFPFYSSRWYEVAVKPCNGKLDRKSDFCTHHWWNWNYSSWTSASQTTTFSQSHFFIKPVVSFTTASTKIHTEMIHLANCTWLYRQELLPSDPCQVISTCPWAWGVGFFANPCCIMQISRTDWNIFGIAASSSATCSPRP